MERAELVAAVEALLEDAPRAHPAYVSEDLRGQWLEQLTLLVEDVLAHTTCGVCCHRSNETLHQLGP
jgi:hypothetical protein